MRKYFIKRIDSFAKCCRLRQQGDDFLHGLHRREKKHLVDDHISYGNHALGGVRARHAKDDDLAYGQNRPQKCPERYRQAVHCAVAVV